HRPGVVLSVLHLRLLNAVADLRGARARVAAGPGTQSGDRVRNPGGQVPLLPGVRAHPGHAARRDSQPGNSHAAVLLDVTRHALSWHTRDRNDDRLPGKDSARRKPGRAVLYARGRLDSDRLPAE